MIVVAWLQATTAMIVMIARAQPMAMPPWTTAAPATAIHPTTAPKIAQEHGVVIHGAAIAAAWLQETPEMIAMIVRARPMAPPFKTPLAPLAQDLA